MSSPTARTLKYLRDEGCKVAIVEKWNPHARIRQDLFGFIDLLVMDDNYACLLGIQVTAGASHAARRTKSLAEPNLAEWLGRGQRFEIHSWAKRGERGKRKVWTLRREALTLSDLG